jgi:hypothetical protein
MARSNVCFVLILIVVLCCCKNQEPISSAGSLTIQGQSLKDVNDYGYLLTDFEAYCNNKKHLDSHKSCNFQKNISEEDLNIILHYIKSLQSDTSCSLTKYGVGFKYRALFSFHAADRQYEVAISDENSQYILIDGKVYDRCKPLYKKLASLMPLKFRKGVKYIDAFSNCCK